MKRIKKHMVGLGAVLMVMVTGLWTLSAYAQAGPGLHRQMMGGVEKAILDLVEGNYANSYFKVTSIKIDGR